MPKKWMTTTSTSGDWDCTSVWYPNDDIMYPEILEDGPMFDLYEYEDYVGIMHQLLAEAWGYVKN